MTTSRAPCLQRTILALLQQNVWPQTTRLLGAGVVDIFTTTPGSDGNGPLILDQLSPTTGQVENSANFPNSDFWIGGGLGVLTIGTPSGIGCGAAVVVVDAISLKQLSTSPCFHGLNNGSSAVPTSTTAYQVTCDGGAGGCSNSTDLLSIASGQPITASVSSDR